MPTAGSLSVARDENKGSRQMNGVGAEATWMHQAQLAHVARLNQSMGWRYRGIWPRASLLRRGMATRHTPPSTDPGVIGHLTDSAQKWTGAEERRHWHRMLVAPRHHRGQPRKTSLTIEIPTSKLSCVQQVRLSGPINTAILTPRGAQSRRTRQEVNGPVTLTSPVLQCSELGPDLRRLERLPDIRDENLRVLIRSKVPAPWVPLAVHHMAEGVVPSGADDVTRRYAAGARPGTHIEGVTMISCGKVLVPRGTSPR